MKTKERYKILNYSKNQYNNAFDANYEFKYLSKKQLHQLIKKYNYSCATILSYCCYGVYSNCWQDPIEKGVWGLSQEQVDKQIIDIINSTAKYCRKDSRILYYKKDDIENVIIIMRDTYYKEDYFICFTNQ